MLLGCWLEIIAAICLCAGVLCSLLVMCSNTLLEMFNVFFLSSSRLWLGSLLYDASVTMVENPPCGPPAALNYEMNCYGALEYTCGPVQTSQSTVKISLYCSEEYTVFRLKKLKCRDYVCIQWVSVETGLHINCTAEHGEMNIIEMKVILNSNFK